MSRTINVLLVDDNDDDAFFIERAFKSINDNIHIFRCIDGQEALSYLENLPPFSSAAFHPRPDFVLLDLKLPVKDGMTVLSFIRGSEALKSLIVAMLTSSADPRDIDRAFELNANAFLVKPGSTPAMLELARAIQVCWLQTRLKLLP